MKHDYVRVPVIVLGCLKSGEITVILLADMGLADGGTVDVIPVEIIPVDLRMPNSKFDILVDRSSMCFVRVLYKDESY